MVEDTPDESDGEVKKDKSMYAGAQIPATPSSAEVSNNCMFGLLECYFLIFDRI
jgi:hypothetical protein